jgi:hypothetical protein
MISRLHCGRKFLPGVANGGELLLLPRHRNADQEAVIGTNTYHIPVLELTTDHLQSVYKRTVPATFVPDEQLVFHAHNTRMVAGDRWVVDHDVIRRVTTHCAEISSFEAVLSYDEISAPQFKLDHG